MKILVITVESPNPSLLLEDDRLINLPYLVGAGSWGKIAQRDSDTAAGWPPLWDHLAAHGKRSILVGSHFDGKQDCASLIDRYPAFLNTDSPLPLELIQTQPWDYFHLIDAIADHPNARLEFDQKIGSLLELISEETIVLVLSLPAAKGAESAEGCFILATQQRAVADTLEGVHLVDLAATLLLLGGFPPLPESPGIPLALAVSESENRGDDDEVIRERLRGLGYIA